MGITAKNQRLIAYKKLVGKSHTSAQKGITGEEFASDVQPSANESFADDPTEIPGGERSNASANTQFATLITFDLEEINLVQYGPEIDLGDGEDPDYGAHGWRLKFPAGNTLGLSGYITDSVKRQLVPPKYGNVYKAAVFKDGNGTQILDTGRQDWILDYYSGILFMQDLGDGDIPLTVSAYYYTGKYISDVLVSDPSTGLITAEFQDLTVNGTLTTNELIVERNTQIVTETSYNGVSTFGNSEDNGDTFDFYGTVNIHGTLNADSTGTSSRSVGQITETIVLDETAEHSVYKVLSSNTEIIIILPNVSLVTNREFIFKRMDNTAQNIKILAAPSQTIDGYDGTGENILQLYAQYESITVISDGSSWLII
jgi:hypothetical protein